MKKLALLAVLAVSFLFAGCSTIGAPIVIQTPQQLVTDFCPIVNADLKLLGASPLLNASQQKLLNGTPGDPSDPGIIGINAAVCQGAAQINISDLQTLNATAFPALIGLVSALPMLPNQPAILFGLMLAEPILAQIINSLPIPAAPAVPASAPNAASSLLVAMR